MRNVTDSINKTWRSSHPLPETPKDPEMESALQDLARGRDLPGLPDLSQTVFVFKSALLCNRSGELGNPSRESLVAIKECVILTHSIQVSVLTPTGDSEEYLMDHYSGIVRVSWRPAQQSNANTYVAWTFIRNLTNKQP